MKANVTCAECGVRYNGDACPICGSKEILDRERLREYSAMQCLYAPPDVLRDRAKAKRVEKSEKKTDGKLENDGKSEDGDKEDYARIFKSLGLTKRKK